MRDALLDTRVFSLREAVAHGLEWSRFRIVIVCFSVTSVRGMAFMKDSGVQ